MRIFGKALKTGGQPLVRLESANGTLQLLQPVTSDDYSLRLDLPATLAPGQYTVRVHNGNGGTAGWRDEEGQGRWVWHSLRHVFCTTALFTWKLDPTDVSRMAGHANYRTTLDMYVGTTAGILDRARNATE